MEKNKIHIYLYNALIVLCLLGGAVYVVRQFMHFGGGIYLGALDGIRGTTAFMIEDVLFLLYATLAGMAVYFPMLFRMK